MLALTNLANLSDELESLVAHTAPAVVGVEHRDGQGSGFAISPDGYVVTNEHVVTARGAKSHVILRAEGGYESRARVVGVDHRTDLAVLHAERPLPVCLSISSENVAKVGQLAVAIGNPLRFERSVALGVVSALDRSLPSRPGTLFEGLIQTDAAINPGNSGGPLLDVRGRVIGINTAIIPYAQGIGFAVPSQTADWVASVLIQRGTVDRPLLGVSARGEELPSQISKEIGQRRAVKLFGVERNTPAHHAGMREGDWLISVNSTPVTRIDDVQRILVLSSRSDADIEIFRNMHRIQSRVFFRGKSAYLA